MAEEEQQRLHTELEQVLSRRDGAGAGLLAWCERATAYLFDASGTAERRILTEWGRAALKLLLQHALQNQTTLPPVLCAWIETNLLPSLGDGCDVTSILLRVLLSTASILQEQQQSLPPPPAATRKRRALKKRRRTSSSSP